MAQKGRQSKRPPTRSSGGIFSSMRGGMKNLVGTGKGRQKKEKITFWDVLFWIVAAILAAALVYRWVK